MFKRKIFVYSTLVFFYLTILSGCGGSSGANFDLDLPGNYSIVSTSAQKVFISPKIGDNHWGPEVIPVKIIEVAWDDNYILAKQLGLVNDPDRNDGSQIPDNKDVNFWILEIGSGKVFGPLDELNFIEKKTELGVSKSVILKKIEDLR